MSWGNMPNCGVAPSAAACSATAAQLVKLSAFSILAGHDENPCRSAVQPVKPEVHSKTVINSSAVACKCSCTMWKLLLLLLLAPAGYLVRLVRTATWGWCRNKVRLEGRTAVVTGANSGIGYETARELARRGARVFLACRTLQSAEAACRAIRAGDAAAQVIPMELDLSSLASIRAFAAGWSSLRLPLHLLVNNAGVSHPKEARLRTADDHEVHFGVNHLGHFALTLLLLDQLKATASGDGARVVIVSSSLHQKGRIDLQLIDRPGAERTTDPYMDSKLANVYFGRELQRRHGGGGGDGAGLAVYTVCPGWVYTNLFRHRTWRWYTYVMVAPIAFWFMRSARQGCQTVVYCCTEPSLPPGLYRNCAWFSSRHPFDAGTAQRLWDYSEQLTATNTNTNTANINTANSSKQ